MRPYRVQLLFACAFLFLLTKAPKSAASEPGIPSWIWAKSSYPLVEDSDFPNITFEFTRSFEIAGPPDAAKLRIAADFCYARVMVNGKRVVAVEPYSETVEVDATQALRIGSNVIQVTAKSIAGPSAIAVSLTAGVPSPHSPLSIVSDESWICKTGSVPGGLSSASNAVSLGSVSTGLWGVGRRSPKVEPTESYEQWRKAISGTHVPDSQFWIAPGFQVTHIRNALPEEGSWVSMAFDPKGRLTIAREAKGLMRMTLGASRDSIECVEVLNDELLECRGLLYAHGALFTNANNSKGLYRLRDSDGDDSLDEVRMLREFSGGVGHGRNDLALGSDGSIYSIHGDSVDFPVDNFLDRTSPFRNVYHARPVGQGYLIRTDADGEKWEVLCSGLRNPYGLAVNPKGDWFTYDADAEFDMGTPWYRPTRVVQLMSGADYGWRAVTGKWPPYFPDHADNAMPTLDIGKGSPTAVLFGTETHFPEEYRRSLFILDWTYGRILAVHLGPRGAGYRANAETFLQGRPLNVTDLAVGPDGALYLITGGRKTQSALYRVAYVGANAMQEPISIHEQHCAEHAVKVRKTRSQLESMHRATLTTSSDSFLWLSLNSSDWQLRHSARVALEHQPIDRWIDRALSETRTQAMVEGLLAILRSGKKEAASLVLDRILQLDLAQLDLSETMGMLQCYSMLAESALALVTERRQEVLKKLQSLFPQNLEGNLTYNRCGSNVLVQAEIAKLLAKLGSEAVVAGTFATLLASPDQETRLHGLFALRNVTVGWSEEYRQEYFRLLDEGSNFVRGEGMEKFLRQIRDEAVLTLSASDRERFSKPLASPVHEIAEVTEFPTRPPTRQWTMRDLIPSLSNSSYKPDVARGQRIFAEAQCSRCHRKGPRGPALGPDLTHIANRFSKRDLLLSILEPSQVIAENYRNAQVQTTDGRSIVGRLLVEGDYRSEKIALATDPFKLSGNVEIPKEDIQSFRESLVSPMPTSLLDGFELDEILDLLAYLQ